MVPRFRPSLRLCGIVLLVLAISPMTAPFSTLDPGLLFDDQVPHSDAVLQAKPPASDTAADASLIFDWHVRLERAEAGTPRYAETPRTSRLLARPLRI